jgi:hypothetical protein
VPLKARIGTKKSGLCGGRTFGVSRFHRMALIARLSSRRGPYWISVLIREFTGSNRATIEPMLLAMFAMRVLEVMFFVGLVGSSVVVLISFVEDGKELFGKDE